MRPSGQPSNLSRPTKWAVCKTGTKHQAVVAADTPLDALADHWQVTVDDLLGGGDLTIRCRCKIKPIQATVWIAELDPRPDRLSVVFDVDRGAGTGLAPGRHRRVIRPPRPRVEHPPRRGGNLLQLRRTADGFGLFARD